MTEVASVFRGLLDDAALVARVEDATGLPLGIGDAAARYRQLRRSGAVAAVGALVVPDRSLAELSRLVEPAQPWPVCVVATGGAGSLLALADRPLPGLELVAVDAALRDLDDLAGNAARVVAAAEQLPESVDVYVELPDVPGWERAVEVVEAAGRYTAVRLPAETTGRGADDALRRLAVRLSVLVEADLPFRLTGLGGTTPAASLLALLVAVQVLVENGDPAGAAARMATGAPAELTETVTGWPEGDAARVRRRLRRVEGQDAAATLDELTRLGAISRV